MPMHFCDLPADVILSIFGAHCDISSVVSAAQTSRYLHVLGFDKSVWLALLTDLKRRNFLEQGYTPVLQELSTEELINLVKRILTGPETWSLQQNGCVNPQIAKQILLHPTVTRGRLPNQNLTDYKLVCGGRYCLYNSNNIIECWDVAEDILLWTHEQAARGDTTVFDFAAEAQNDGDFLMVMTCLLEDGLPCVNGKPNRQSGY
ncbi:hypothetical protein B0H19DRAFT_464229 [Mycena capillaripes]|nr:hypothetical protein B0H19DRAFT_464229 [Mycena capillaripes]